MLTVPLENNTILKMNEHTRYFFHRQLEVFRCGGGVLMCYILGNRISFFEESIDENFSSFILKNIKSNKSFSVTDMIGYFSKTGKKYNFGKILQGLKTNGLVNEQDDKPKQEKDILFINLTDISDQEILSVFQEVNLKRSLKLIKGLQLESDGKSLYKKLEEESIKDNQTVFVMSDFQHKHKVSELNLYFFKKGVFWCPLIIDAFGGYIGPLLHSVPSGPCFSCYEKRIYIPNSSADEIAKPPVLLNIFLRVIFLEALKIVTKVSPSQVIYSNLLEIDCWNHRSRKHYIYADSDCPVCGV